ncbi:hypothetical protein T484DRAFT_1829024, partial [Baffinella frigidus]
VWHYICFVIQVSLKPKTELTGTEQYVIEELAAARTDWFPALRSVELEDGLEAGAEEEESAERSPSAYALCQHLLRLLAAAPSS